MTVIQVGVEVKISDWGRNSALDVLIEFGRFAIVVFRIHLENLGWVLYRVRKDSLKTKLLNGCGITPTILLVTFFVGARMECGLPSIRQVLIITGRPEIARYFEMLGAQLNRERVVATGDGCKADVPEGDFSNSPFFSFLPNTVNSSITGYRSLFLVTLHHADDFQRFGDRLWLAVFGAFRAEARMVGLPRGGCPRRPQASRSRQLVVSGGRFQRGLQIAMFAPGKEAKHDDRRRHRENRKRNKFSLGGQPGRRTE